MKWWALTWAVFVMLGTWVFASGLWLVSQSDYPYWRTVGGATLAVLGIIALVGAAVLAISKAESP